MKIKPEQLDRLAEQLLSSYRNQDILAPKAPEAAIKAKIVEIVAGNFAEEEAIEEEARRLLATHARATREMDPYKMFLLAKQKLAAQKGFIL